MTMEAEIGVSRPEVTEHQGPAGDPDAKRARPDTCREQAALPEPLLRALVRE